MTWWVIAWLLLAVGQRALGRMSDYQRSQLKPREESRAFILEGNGQWSQFIGPRNSSRLPGRAPGLHRLDRPNRTTLRLIWLSEDRRMSGRKLFPGHKEGNGTK